MWGQLVVADGQRSCVKSVFLALWKYGHSVTEQVV